MRFPAGWLVHAVYVFILGLVVITSFLPGHRASPLPVVVAHYIRSRLAALVSWCLRCDTLMVVWLHDERSLAFPGPSATTIRSPISRVPSAL